MDNTTINMPNTKEQKRKTKRLFFSFGLIFLLLLCDQAIKFAVKLHMALGDSIRITDWFYIYFTENPGMAFGWEIFSKSFLTIFRLLASGGLCYLLIKIAKSEYGKGLLICLSAILAGALGNIIDSVFYGQIFSHSYSQVASLFPENGGYAGWLHGRVVDMFYFPLFSGHFPEWLPYIGGDSFVFFQPIFNFADACISVGVFCLLLFHSRSFAHLLSSSKS